MADYVGTSVGDDGHRIGEMWGGNGGGSWIYTKLPDNTAVHANSAAMVEQIVQSAFGVNPYTTVASYPTINIDVFTATVNVIPSDQPLVPVYMYGGQAREGWAMARNGMAQEGFPIPEGMQPTVYPPGHAKAGQPDTDGTLVLYQPDKEWVGRPGDEKYKGWLYELWGAISPEQNAALGNPARWTCKQPGRFPGVKNWLHAHGRGSGSPPFSYADANRTNRAGYIAGPSELNPDQSKRYTGYGPEGVACETTMLSTATHIPFSHTVISLRDLSRPDPDTGKRGYIDHAFGFMLYGVPKAQQAGNVWPAVGYDRSSRIVLPHGSRLRLPADFVLDENWPDEKYMLCKALRDYGMFFGDTGGTGLTLRMEPGAWGYLPAGFSKNGFMKTIPWGSLEGMQVGSDSQYNILSDEEPPEEPPVDPPDEPPPPPGTMIAGHGRFRGARLT